MPNEIEEARKTLAKAEKRAHVALGWKDIKTAPKNGDKVHLWLQIHASPLSMGMSDAFAVPDAWFDGRAWVHMYRGKPAELDPHYITSWQPASSVLPSGMDVWHP